MRAPCPPGRQPPQALAAVALVKGALAGGIVDVRRPQRRHHSGHGGSCQHPGEDLQGVDEGLALGEDHHTVTVGLFRRMAEDDTDLTLFGHDML